MRGSIFLARAAHGSVPPKAARERIFPARPGFFVAPRADLSIAAALALPNMFITEVGLARFFAADPGGWRRVIDAGVNFGRAAPLPKASDAAGDRPAWLAVWRSR